MQFQTEHRRKVIGTVLTLHRLRVRRFLVVVVLPALVERFAAFIALNYGRIDEMDGFPMVQQIAPVTIFLPAVDTVAHIVSLHRKLCLLIDMTVFVRFQLAIGFIARHAEFASEWLVIVSMDLFVLH